MGVQQRCAPTPANHENVPNVAPNFLVREQTIPDEDVRRAIEDILVRGKLQLGRPSPRQRAVVKDRSRRTERPFFVHLPSTVYRLAPDAWMEGHDAKRILVGKTRDGAPKYYLAVDDAKIMALASRSIHDGVLSLRDLGNVKYWVIGGEEAYPEYFAFPPADFRPASLDHFKAFLPREGQSTKFDKENLLGDGRNSQKALWRRFRERALADRAAAYFKVFVGSNAARPVSYPTHGNPFCGDLRMKLGHPPSLLAGAPDGFETGQILIGDDKQMLNLLTLAHLSAFGSPVVTPRRARVRKTPESGCA